MTETTEKAPEYRRKTLKPGKRSHLTLIAVAGLSVGTAVLGARTVGPSALHHPVNSTAKPDGVVAKAKRWLQMGRASWYGEEFQGEATASGEVFDMNGLTCAHRTLPLGSLVKVTNLRNRKSVVVRVNDRGPVPEDRIIDLSYAAAQTLGFGRRGTAPVKLELLNEAKLHWPRTIRPAATVGE